MSEKYILAGSVSLENKIKHSRFITHLQPVQSLPEVKEFIRQINALHPTATHNCWAYILGVNGEVEHFSDQGEPSGSAGKPMLNALLHVNLTNVVAVVTRYFGGTKLGIPGLIEAYYHCVLEAVPIAGTKLFVPMTRIELTTDYANHEFLAKKLKAYQAGDPEIRYEQSVSMSMDIPIAQRDELLMFMEEWKRMGRLKDWKEEITKD